MTKIIQQKSSCFEIIQKFNHFEPTKNSFDIWIYMKFKHGKTIQHYLPNFLGQIDFFSKVQKVQTTDANKKTRLYTAFACIIPNTHKIIFICFSVLIILTFIFSTFLKIDHFRTYKMFTQRIEYEAQLTKCFKTMLPNGKKNTKYHLKNLS